MNKKFPGHILRVCATFCALIFLFLAPARGQREVPGVTENTIRIGSCAALEGPASFLGLQMIIGARAYFGIINDQGGVHGRKIELVTANDSYDPDQAPGCFERLMKEDVFAGAFFVGTPTAVKYIPLAEAKKFPILGFFTGAQILYEPPKRYIFNVRASYFDETREQVDNLWDALGYRKIGVLYQDDAFGKAVLEGVDRALERHHSAPVARGTFPRNTLDVAEGIKEVRAANPEAVVLVGPYAPVAAILKQARAEGWHPLFLTVSFVGTEGLLRAAPQDSEGIVITQVVPPYDRTDLPTVKLYRDALQKYMGNTPPSFISLEGFVDAMTLTDALKLAGKDLTREKLVSAIESIHNEDIGLGPKMLLTFSASNHKGLGVVYPTVIQHGRAVIVTDWKQLAK
jgi:ABC-type branched-subunit amino acid transport system substrate-binding protein